MFLLSQLPQLVYAYRYLWPKIAVIVLNQFEALVEASVLFDEELGSQGHIGEMIFCHCSGGDQVLAIIRAQVHPLIL